MKFPTTQIFSLGSTLSVLSAVSAQPDGNDAAAAYEPSGGWEHGVNWSKVFPGSKNAPQPVQVNTAANVNAAPATINESSGSSVQSPSNEGSGSSTASCPDGCQMTIVFSDDSLDVPFAVGNHGTPANGRTKDTCICLHGGSVRVSIGTTGTYEPSTLIEGSASGFNSASFFDVSYVEAYNYPVVCWTEEGAMSGSNVDLYTKGKCPGGQSKMGEVCMNPGFEALANGGDNCWQCTLPDAFFGPASGAAYTYPRDDSLCSSDGGATGTPMGNGGRLTCCVGPSCRSNTQSPGGKTSGGRCDSGCTPCAGHGSCSSCSNSSKRDLAALFQAAGPSARKHKRHALDHKAGI